MMSEIIIVRQLIERHSPYGGSVEVDAKGHVTITLYHSLERSQKTDWRLPSASFSSPWALKTLIGEIFASFYQARLEEVRGRLSGPMPSVLDFELEEFVPRTGFDTFSDLPEVEILEEESSSHTVEAVVPEHAVSAWLALTEETQSEQDGYPQRGEHSTVAFDSGALARRLQERETERETQGFVTTPGQQANVADQLDYLSQLFASHGGRPQRTPSGGFLLIIPHPQFGGEYRYELTAEELAQTPAAALVERVLSQTNRIPKGNS